MKLNTLVSFGLAGLAFSFNFSQADDWPQWRGPNRDGISKETGLLKKWPEGGPRLAWQAHGLGDGYSTPSVVGQRIFLLGNEGMDNEFVQALNVADGKRIWSTRIGKVGPNDPRMNFPGGRSTPTVEGDVLYVLGSDGDLACVSISEGKLQWQKNLRQEFGGKPGNWAYAESPLIDGDVLICTPGGAEATIVALNKKNGELIWKCAAGDDEAAYSSPVLAQAGGARQYVQLLQKGLVGVDAKSGKLLWRWDKPAQGSPANIPTPLVYEEHIFAGSGRAGGGVIKVHPKNGAVEVEEVFFEKKVPTGVGGALRVGDHLYGGGESILCLEFKTGRVLWEERALPSPSACFADERIYLHGDNGDIALIEANPEAYREHGRFTPPDQPNRPGRVKAWTYPVVANGRLYIRDLGTMWCYDIRAPLTASN